MKTNLLYSLLRVIKFLVIIYLIIIKIYEVIIMKQIIPEKSSEKEVISNIHDSANTYDNSSKRKALVFVL